MTSSHADLAAATEIRDGPYDLEFFLDPICPFAWQTSLWIRRVAELRDLSIGWRFISLFFIHEHDTDSEHDSLDTRRRSLGLLRLLDAIRSANGNDAVGDMYRAWGQRLWYTTSGGSSREVVPTIDLAALLQACGLPADLADAVSDDRHDMVIRAETALALERAGDDLGTPIISFDPPRGPSFFGPVISAVPDDEQSLAIFDALSSLTAFDGFAEFKRTNRPPLDLPIVNPPLDG